MMSIVYGVLTLACLGLLIASFVLNKHKSIWFKMLCLSVFIYNMGYFIISISKAKWLALVGNSVAYLGSVFLPFFLFLMILDIFKFKKNKYLLWSLFSIGILMFVLAISPAFSNLFYKSYDILIKNGSTIFVKEYGTLHFLYAIYLMLYFAAMLAIVIFASVKKHYPEDKRQGIFILCALIGNLAIWAIEKIIDTNFEFLTISYLTTEARLLFMDSITSSIKNKYTQEQKEKEANVKELLTRTGFEDAQICEIMKNWQSVGLLTEKEKEIFFLMLKNEKRKNIAQLSFITENTVKKHTAAIFKKLKVTSREELFMKAQNYLKSKV